MVEKRAEANMEWHLNQVFGGGDKPADAIGQADIVSALEFDHNGEYLAAGDRGGRVVVFKKDDSKDKARKPGDPGCKLEYKFYHEFQSHEREFDCLKSLEIEEAVNKIRFLKPRNDSQLLITTNDKTIKLWKVFNKSVKRIITSNDKQPETTSNTSACLHVPRVVSENCVRTAVVRKVFSNAHAYHINSISVNSDQETYISADDLRINLWNLSCNNQSFNVVDIKPNNMDELSEVITCAEFHPQQCSQFAYSTSKGVIRLADLRQSALCDRCAKSFQEPEDPSNKSFFSEILASISDIKFSSNGRYIISRDYMTLKLWDINMERQPLKTIRVHDYLKSKLCDVYESDYIFDKFECAISGDCTQMVTGSYNRNFVVCEVYGRNEVVLQANRVQTKPTPNNRLKMANINPDTIDYTKKTLHVAFHPCENVLAVTALNNLFIFTA
eukprot:TRINITY_DN18388_c0_g1_i1.p1 TRINITY_DN18388_c0_g1~~TRINITY_DN18388_c0_g1_i1.p1  ORF type:complete len:465 (+),score=132.73 TRINITY_DN18388_c0_g1_i1:71-1396(+)